MPELKLPLKLVFSPEAKKALSKMDARDEGDIIDGLDRFAITGTPRPKPLTGQLKGLYRLRFGGRRVVFELNGDLVTIAYIDRRDRVYKR